MSSAISEPRKSKAGERPANESGAAPDSGGKSNAIKALGGFELICKIGQGGMGSVFKARQVSLDRIVAVKVLPPSVAKMSPHFVDRFIREARTSARLNHPNIVQGIDVDKDEATGLYYFAMEFIDGPTARTLLKEQRVIPQARAIEITIGVTEALICAHRAGIIHRDVKPDNILLTSKGEVKLADLGLARGFSSEHDDDTVTERKRTSTSVELTQAGARVGTPAYMAPEQIRGEADECDVRTDLYALGATFFHLVTGKFPYSAKTSAAVMNMHLNSPVPVARELNPEVSEEVSSVIFKLLQKDPAKRYQTAEDLADALDDIIHKKGMRIATSNYRRVTTSRVAPVTAERESVRVREKDKEKEKEKQPKAKPISPVLIAGVALVGLALIAGVSLMLGSKTPEKVESPKNDRAQVAPVAIKEVKPAPAPAKVATPDKQKQRVEEARASEKPVAAAAVPVDAAKPNTATAGKKDEKIEDKEGKVEAPVVEADKAPAEPKPMMGPPAPSDNGALAASVEKAAAEKLAALPKAPTLQEQAMERMKEQFDKQNLIGAYNVLKQFEAEKKLADADKTALDGLFETEVEARAKALVSDAQVQAANGAGDKAIEMLEAARIREGKDLGKGELEARRIVTAARDAITTKKAMSQMNTEIKQSTRLEGLLQAESAALADNNPPEQVARLLDQAISRPDMADAADFLKTEKKTLMWVNDVRTSILAGTKDLTDGRVFSFSQASDQKETRVGKNETLHVTSTDDVNLYISSRRGNPHSVKIDSLSRGSRLALSLMTCADKIEAKALDAKDAKAAEQRTTEIKQAEAKMKVKWAYCDLVTLKPGTQKMSGIVDDADKTLQDAARDKVPAEMLDAVRPWLLRGQNLVRAARRNNPAHSPITPYLQYVSISSGPRCKITINGKVFVQSDDRGINVVAVDGEQQVLKENYDVASDPEAARKFSEAIAKLPKTALVIVTIWDDKGLTDLPAQTLGSLGGTMPVQTLPKKDAYYLIGMPGLGGGLGTDEMGPAGLGFPHR